jgi:hypothetical protein
MNIRRIIPPEMKRYFPPLEKGEIGGFFFKTAVLNPSLPSFFNGEKLMP